MVDKVATKENSSEKEPSNLIELIQFLKKKNVETGQYIRHIEWFLEQKARRLGIPLNGTFELTPLCNLDCKMCYIHLTNMQFKVDKLLSVDTWKHLMKEAYVAGMRTATLTGGECLTYYGFDDLYLYLYNMGVKIQVLSNGILFNRRRIDFFKKYAPSMIQISLYGSSDEEYEKVTGKRVFTIVYNNLKILKESDLPVVISITPNSNMSNSYSSLMSIAIELGIPFHINSKLLSPRKNTSRHCDRMSVEQYVQIYKTKKVLEGEQIIPLDFEELPSENHFGQKRFGLRCGGGRSSFTIQYDGNMSPCIGLYDIKDNVIEKGFDTAWHNINIIANSYPLPEECADCFYAQYCIRCPALHGASSQPGHCDTEICNLTKALIKEGIISNIKI